MVESLRNRAAGLNKRTTPSTSPRRRTPSPKLSAPKPKTMPYEHQTEKQRQQALELPSATGYKAVQPDPILSYLL